jgi:hypothetical protein
MLAGIKPAIVTVGPPVSDRRLKPHANVTDLSVPPASDVVLCVLEMITDTYTSASV